MLVLRSMINKQLQMIGKKVHKLILEIFKTHFSRYLYNWKTHVCSNELREKTLSAYQKVPLIGLYLHTGLLKGKLHLTVTRAVLKAQGKHSWVYYKVGLTSILGHCHLRRPTLSTPEGSWCSWAFPFPGKCLLPFYPLPECPV